MFYFKFLKSVSSVYKRYINVFVSYLYSYLSVYFKTISSNTINRSNIVRTINNNSIHGQFYTGFSHNYFLIIVKVVAYVPIIITKPKIILK